METRKPNLPARRRAAGAIAAFFAALAFGWAGCGEPQGEIPRAATPSGTTAPAATAPEKSASAPVKPYPLDVCLVSGQKLGSMGASPSIVHEGQEIKFCCSGCVPEFRKDPSKYLKKLP